MNDLKTGPAYQVLPISVGAVSETGQREQNQDSMTGFSSPFGAVYLIADGMGGHRGGAEASRMVAEAFNRHLLAAPASSPPRDAVTLAVRLANVEILEKGKSGNADFEGMGSTVVIAMVRQNGNQLELTTAHVGDSRVYLQRNGSLTLLTKDHTQVQWLIDNHAIDESSARNHPDASVLTRALGHTTDLQVDISEPLPLLEGDGILLCSDGLSGFARAEDIKRTIGENPDPTRCANQLVQLALAAGSNDNITVQFLRIGATAQAVTSRAPAAPAAAAPARHTQRTGTPTASAGKMISIIALLLVLAGMVWWVRRPKPVPVDNSLSQLEQRVNTFKDNAAALSADARQSKDAVHGEFLELAKLKGKATSNLQKDLKGLKKEFPAAEKKFGEILAAADSLGHAASDRLTELASLRKSSDQPQKSQKQAERQEKIDKLTKALGTNEADLKNRQAEMNDLKLTQADMEKRKLELEAAWKEELAAGHSAGHATPDQGDKPPEDAPKPPADAPKPQETPTRPNNLL
jgi:serine/threonine protein phosphatase PrpC